MKKDIFDDVCFQALASHRNNGADEARVRGFLGWNKKLVADPEKVHAALQRLAVKGRARRVGERWYLTPIGYREARGPADRAEWRHEDAWMLLAVCMTSGGDGARLSSILGTADYINHAIPTWEDVHGSVNRLAAGRLLRIRQGLFAATERALEMLERVRAARGGGPLRQVDGLRRLIACPCCGIELGKVRWSIVITEAQWRDAYEEYRAE